MYEYRIKYYGRGLIVREAYRYANSAEAALLNFRKDNDDVVEIICCVEVR